MGWFAGRGAPLRRDNFSAPSHSLQTVQFYPWQTLHLWWMSQCTRNFEIYGLLIGNRTAKEAWVRIPGKHRNADAAWDAMQGMISTPGH